MAPPRKRPIVPGARNHLKLAPHTNFHAQQQPRPPGAVAVWTQEPALLAFNSSGHDRIGEAVSHPPEVMTDAPASPVWSLEAPRRHDFDLPPYLLSYDEKELSFAQILCLAGDYYARVDNEDDTYSGSRQGWENDTLVEASAEDIRDTLDFVYNVEFSSKASAAFDSETKALAEAMGAEAAGGMWGEHTVDAANNDDFQRLFYKKDANGKPTKPNRAIIRYTALAITNWDHFHPHCLRRYQRLHDKAVEFARRTGVAMAAAFKRSAQRLAPDPAKGDQATLFRRALTYEAFAQHFLTDAFSAGHLIGDRYRVYHDAVTDGYDSPFVGKQWFLSEDGTARVHLPGVRDVRVLEAVAGKDALARHDTLEGADGLEVNSTAHPGKYRIWGDSNLFRFETSGGDDTQWQQLQLACRMSLRKIYEAFVRGLGLTPIFDANEPESPLGYVPHRLDRSCCADSTPSNPLP